MNAISFKNFIENYDSQNQFQVLCNTYKQIEFAISNHYPEFIFNKNDINNIIISGLGGSAISGDLIKNFLQDDLKLSVQVNRNYNLPNYVDKNSLVICSSYSGNTEETISACFEAIRRECKIICISTGGELQKIANQFNLPFVGLQGGYQPRYALGMSFASLIIIFEKLGLIPSQFEYLQQIISLWKIKAEQYSNENNFALNVATKLIGFVPIIYAVSDFNDSVSFRLKAQINENSKLHAFYNLFPEMNHNEIIGWESHNQKHFNTKVIFLTDDDMHIQIKKRFDIIYQMITSNDVEIITLKSSEKNFKIRIMDLIFLADWISYYLAILRRFDPSEIDFINILKNKLTKL